MSADDEPAVTPMRVARQPTIEEATMMRRHARQRLVCIVTSPVWILATIAVLRFYLRYRIAEIESVRAEYRRIRRQSDAPILVCANHLTLIDSFLVAWALGSGGYWLRHPDELPWNLPERTNFGQTRLARILIYVLKSILITRGGDRSDIAGILLRIRKLLVAGETALIFPEAGRSRTGRVDQDAGAWGVGRVVGAVPNCRVLCVYLRGRKQETWSDIPAKGDVLDVSLACIEPKSDAKGVRRSQDIAHQITRQLATMEGDYFDARQ